MAENLAVVQNQSISTCCDKWKEKYSELREKHTKAKGFIREYRDCTTLLGDKLNAIEKENACLKQALADLKVQANGWKDEKEHESTIRIDLENEVSVLKDEIKLFKQNGHSASQEADGQLQERLNSAEKEVNRLKDLLDQEKSRADLEKKNTEIERKKTDESLKQLEIEKKKSIQAKNAADIERKKAHENKLLWEKLKVETDAVKSKLGLERSKSESANKQVEAEKQNTIRERKRADLAKVKADKHRELAETNLKKAIAEKNRADDLEQKLNGERNRVAKLHEQLRGHDGLMGIAKKEAEIEKLIMEKEKQITREKKRADSEMKKAKQQQRDAETHKKMAIEEKHQADQLSRELDGCKVRFEELQKKFQELVSCRTHADHPLLRYNYDISDRDDVKLVKKELKLEKMLVKHAKKVAKVEILRNKMLHQELFYLKQEFLRLQQPLDKPNSYLLHGGECTRELEKTGNRAFTRDTLYSDDYQRQQLVSGISSELDPQFRGSNRKMSIVNSSSTSFSDRSLGTQEKSPFSVTTSDKLGEDLMNREPNLSTFSDKTTIGNNIRSPVKEKRKILDKVESVENVNSKGKKLHELVSNRLSILHDILDGQNPLKKRKTSCDKTVATHPLDSSDEPKIFPASNKDFDPLPTGSDVMKLPLDFDNIATSDCLKLLELDNPADEEAYRRAIASPLSPTLPDIKFPEDEELELDNPESFDSLLQTQEVSGRFLKNPDVEHIPKYFVVSSGNKDNHSILRILHTISRCTPQCSLLHSPDGFLQTVQLTLSKAEDLSLKEKLSVFFSIILQEVSEIETKRMENVCTVVSDLVLKRTICTESFNLFELCTLIEDFLLQREVLKYGVGGLAEPQAIASPVHLLVAGGSLLASLCSAMSHIGFVCETSCNLLPTHKFDPTIVLPILHAFARLCGDNFFTLQQYALAMTVVKSMVTFLEKKNLIWSCESSPNCPFLEGSVPMEDVALLLLEKLREYGSTFSWSESVVDQHAPDENLCNFTDILSLLDGVASIMNWDWTFGNIIGPLYELLESSVTEGFSAAIIVLLGQLGRLGVAANGYEDTGVEKLRRWLCTFLGQIASGKSSIPVQFTTVTALFELIPIKFEELVKSKDEPQAITDQSSPANLIKKWFFHLSDEHQSFFRVHIASTKTDCRFSLLTEAR